MSVRPTARPVRRLAAIAAALTIAGCGLLPAAPHAGGSGDSASSGRPVPGSAARTGSGSGELPTPPGPPQRVDRGAHSPLGALRSFAQAYINWDAADVASRLLSLAEDSVGQARSELELEAQETRRDRELHRGGVGNAGVVEAVSALPGRRLTFVVVTRERTIASRTAAYAGLSPAWHVTLATVARVPLRGARHGWRWALSGWQPES